ncbi:MAG: superoxide dismutase [Oscillospiraceae bacterium]|nr:superoxide dismutase [Oscillospiraceae bacterium]
MRHYPFELPPLPYAYGALEPYIDTLTMELHHDRHLKTYVDNLNAALKGFPEYQSWSLERLITQAGWLPDALRTPVKNNAGGVYNHIFFFNGMSPPAGRGDPDAPRGDKSAMPAGTLLTALERDFSGVEGFIKAFSAAAAGVFGSGYAWLAVMPEGKLTILKTANQDTPLTRNLCPLVCIDVWEHAYYLKHYNKRPDYIQDWLHIVDWDRAAGYFSDAQAL